MTSIKTLTAPLLTVLTAGVIAFSASGIALAQTPYGQPQPYGPQPYGNVQTQGTNQQDAFAAVLGALFGNGSSLDGQWLRGQRPLNAGRTQFEARLTADVRSGALTTGSAARLRSDYDGLVQQESAYAADGRFTTQERSDLNQRYLDLTRRIDAGETDDEVDDWSSVAGGRAEFETRVAAAVNARRITRTEGTRLRADYQALIQTEAGYQRDGLSMRERDDLESRLDALDARLGDGPTYGGGNGGYSPVLPPRTRLLNIETALTTGERNGTISRTEAADIRVEHGDLTRLEAAYARTTPDRDDTDYLARRLGELEVRARVNMRR